MLTQISHLCYNNNKGVLSDFLDTYGAVRIINVCFPVQDCSKVYKTRDMKNGSER
jgi:hypothetical protein